MNCIFTKKMKNIIIRSIRSMSMLKLKENRGIKNYLGRTRILMVAMMVIMAVVASLWEIGRAHV